MEQGFGTPSGSILNAGTTFAKEHFHKLSAIADLVTSDAALLKETSSETKSSDEGDQSPIHSPVLTSQTKRISDLVSTTQDSTSDANSQSKKLKRSSNACQEHKRKHQRCPQECINRKKELLLNQERLFAFNFDPSQFPTFDIPKPPPFILPSQPVAPRVELHKPSEIKLPSDETVAKLVQRFLHFPRTAAPSPLTSAGVSPSLPVLARTTYPVTSLPLPQLVRMQPH
jgi:hypothetical protein